MSVDLGPRLGLLINASIGETYYDQLRPFLRAIDALLQSAVINSTTTTPPSSPSNGDAYLLLGSPSGAWTGQANSIAVWSTEITQSGNNTKVPGWEFLAPNNGWAIWDANANVLMTFQSGTWRNLLFDVPLLSNNNNWVGSQGFVGGWLSRSDVSVATPSSATSSANFNSPDSVSEGTYWDGSVSQQDQWHSINTLGAGTNPTSTLAVTHTGSSGAASVAVPALALTAATTASTATAGSASLPANPVGFVEVPVNGTTVKIPYYAT